MMDELTNYYDEQISLLNKKIYLLENGFKMGQA